ncbi:hypothetical protein DRN97_11115 [Methanosarcinales archaeon]|nr:MAG: hypothetical protein DRN97_11115 [Methanosarcinales archaeon]
MSSEKIPGWIERLLLPKLNEITGEIKAIHTRIDSVERDIASLDNKVDVRIDSLRKEMLAKFESVDAKVTALDNKVDVKFESLRNEMISKFDAVDFRFDSLEARIPVMEKMAEFEVRLAELEKKVTA